MGAITFAEQQPVAGLALGNPRLEQAAQAGQARAVTQQNHRHRGGGQMKATVASYPQADRRTHGGVLG
ncbi:hypothetical protein D3C71_1816330 [compost metagenome]